MDIECYGQKGGIKLMQNEIKHSSDDIKLAWKPRWLLSPAAMAKMLAKGEKRTASVKVTVISLQEKDWLVRIGI